MNCDDAGWDEVVEWCCHNMGSPLYHERRWLSGGPRQVRMISDDDAMVFRIRWC